MRRTTIALVAATLVAGCSTAPERESASTGPTPATGPAATTTDARLRQYVQLRRQLESQDPQMAQAFRSGDLSAQRARLEAALSGSSMSVDELIRIHRQVESDPRLRARVEAELAAPGTSGAPAPQGGTAPGWRGAPEGATPPTTSSGAGSSGASPSASPQ